MNEKTGIKALALLRLMVGLWLVWLVLPNLDRSFIEGLPSILENFAFANPNPFYRTLLHRIAIPNAEQLGSILCVGQLLAGVALTIGFLGRMAAVAGVVYAINFLFVAGHQSVYHQGFGTLLLITFIALFIGDAGRYYGLDGFLFRRSEGSASKTLKIKDKKQREAVDKLTKQLKQSSAKKGKAKSPAKVK